ncbi:sigma-70 family RNA polymerase sigma factor [Paenibacillus sp. GCM10027626]|uniref:sigma-70 family RNA polymerase sigma factor n=1 Tax=Paenibacillus sp. GCM10027626 TaxID=3273411 RepID=UPI0036364319
MLMKEFELHLYRMAWSMLRHDADCADAVQEAILKAYQSLHTLREPAFFKTWIFRILINECNKLLNKRTPSFAGAELQSSPSGLVEYENIDLRELVDHLEESLRIVIILHYFHDLPLVQIADVLGISNGAVKTRLHRGRKQLFSWLKNTPERTMRCGT